MLPAAYVFAAVDLLTGESTKGPGQRFNNTDILIILTAAVAVAVAIVIWLVFFRKSEPEEYEYPEPKPAQAARDEAVEPGERRRRRKRRRVRDHRPRNPTLDQTGGLPPPRPDDQAPPY